MAKDDGRVTVQLAHPLQPGNEFLADGAAAQAGDPVQLTPAQVRHLAGAGWIVYDASNPVEVDNVLGRGLAPDATPDAPGLAAAGEPDAVVADGAGEGTAVRAPRSRS